MQIRQFVSSDEPAVVRLWQQSGLVRATNDPHKDITRKLLVGPDLFLVAELDGIIVGTVMAGYEGHRGWINYLAVAPERRREGIARALMDEAERRLRELGCPKINLQVRRSNQAVLQFYARLGFVDDDVVSLGKRLEHDE